MWHRGHLQWHHLPTNYLKICQSFQKLLVVDPLTHAHRQVGDLISLISFLESRLKINTKCVSIFQKLRYVLWHNVPWYLARINRSFLGPLCCSRHGESWKIWRMLRSSTTKKTSLYLLPWKHEVSFSNNFFFFPGILGLTSLYHHTVELCHVHNTHKYICVREEENDTHYESV
jgi:hypothetical protein